MLYNEKDLLGLKLAATDGEIGKVKDLYFDDESWTIRYLIADTGTWLTGKRVLISPFALEDAAPVHGHIHVNLTRRQIEQSPPISTDQPVSRQYEVEYYKHYGWPIYWYGPALWGPGPYPVYYGHGGGPAEPRAVRTDEGADPHLRSTREVAGYHIQASDGEIGHVDDFIVDDQNWAIRYLVVDTRNWLPGKKVLVARQWIDRVSWHESKVFVGLHRDTIANAPAYETRAGITREYETHLHRHYGRDGYWTSEPAPEPVRQA